MNIDPESLLSVPYTFNRRAEQLPVDVRPLWRLAAICLMLGFSRATKASIQKLQILNWAIRTSEGQLTLTKFLTGKIRPESVVVRFDPAFPVALDLFIGEKMGEVTSSGSIALLEKGRRFYDLIISDKDCMRKECDFLKGIKPHFVEGNIQKLLANTIGS